jgi:hypothetical protein
MHILRTNSGKYFPSFFSIKVDKIGTDIELFQDDSLKTVIHELLHFMQDVSTTIGYINMSHTAISMADFYNEKKKGNVIKLPYISSDRIKETNRDLFSIYIGRTKYEKIPKEIELDIIETNEKVSDSISLPVFEIKITAYGVEKTYSFCGIDIMEGMASIFEQWFFPNTDSFYYIPYDIPTLIAQKIYKEVFQDERMVFSLCDASLLFYNSAEIFIKAIKMMKQEQFKPKNYIEIYNFVFTHVRISGTTIFDQLNKDKELALAGIRNILNSSYLDFAKEWAVNTINGFGNLRKQTPHFLSNILFEEDKQKGILMFYDLFKKYGSPIIHDNSDTSILLIDINSSYSDNEIGTMEYWIVLRNIYEGVFYTGNIICPFLTRCSSNCCKIKTEENKQSYCTFKYGMKLIGFM